MYRSILTWIFVAACVSVSAQDGFLSGEGNDAERQPDAMPRQMSPERPGGVAEVMHFDGCEVSAAFGAMDFAGSESAVVPVASVGVARQVVLLIGDSMVGGLGARFNDYAVKNDFEFHSIVWNGSTTRDWAIASDLQYQIERLHPTYILISLGTNDLGYRDYGRREEAVRTILSRVGDIPYTWIGPLPWNKVKDRTIVDVIRGCTGEERFFDSSFTACSRVDGVHPTRQGAAGWADAIAEWMSRTQALGNILELEKPDYTTRFRHDELHPTSYRGRR